MSAAFVSPQVVITSSPLGFHRKCPPHYRIRVGTKAQTAVRLVSQLQIKPTDVVQQTVVNSSEKWDGMVLFFVSKTVAIKGLSSLQLRIHIENMLQAEGDPVRWAITKVDKMQGTCEVDAVLSHRNTVGSSR